MAAFVEKVMPRTMAGRRTVTGYLFIMPFILGFLLWFLIPALVAVWLTFQRWNLISPPEYVGLENVVHLWNDKLFWQSLKVTINDKVALDVSGDDLSGKPGPPVPLKKGRNTFRAEYTSPSCRSWIGVSVPPDP